MVFPSGLFCADNLRFNSIHGYRSTPAGQAERFCGEAPPTAPTKLLKVCHLVVIPTNEAAKLHLVAERVHLVLGKRNIPPTSPKKNSRMENIPPKSATQSSHAAGARTPRTDRNNEFWQSRT